MVIVYEKSNNYDGILYHAYLRMSVLGSLFSSSADLLMIMTLAELGNGFLFCLTQTRTALQKAVRYIAVVSCAILFMLVIALFGVYNAEYSQHLSSRWYSGFEENLYEASRRMSSAFSIITFVLASLLVAFAAVVLNKTKRNYVLRNVSRTLFPLQDCSGARRGQTNSTIPVANWKRLLQSAVLFLVAAVLNLIVHLYALIYVSVFVLADFQLYRHYETYTAIMFVDPVITVWIYTAAVAFVFVIVIRKRNGLWTTLQPWMDEQGPPALAANPSLKGPGEQWQQPSDSHVLRV